MGSRTRTAGIGLAVVALGTAAGCGSSSGSSTKTSTAASDSSGSGGYGYGGSKTTDASTATTAGATGTGTGTGKATVSVAANATAKTNILVGPNGHTLYLLETEMGTTSSCTGPCAPVWPALSAPTVTAGAGVDASGLAAASGQVPNQVAYKGHLLYYFANDLAAGDVKGTSIPHWYPVAPDGKKVDNS